MIARVSLERRRVCQWLLLPALPWWTVAAHAATVAAARLWPAQEYTRLILESSSALPHQMLAIKNPERLVLDLEDVEFTNEIAQLAQRLQPSDPYIQSIRVARFKPGVVRVVLELKTEVNPQLFALPPVADYGHRVVLDLYPLTPPDPLMALLDFETGGARDIGADTAPTDRFGPTERAPPVRSSPRPVCVGRLSSRSIRPRRRRPGAVGPRGTYENRHAGDRKETRRCLPRSPACARC